MPAPNGIDQPQRGFRQRRKRAGAVSLRSREFRVRRAPRVTTLETAASVKGLANSEGSATVARSMKALFILYVGFWYSLLAAQDSTGRPSTAPDPVEMAGDPIRIGDLGLEDRIPSAIDLVGPEHGSAGRHRAALADRLRCWIDGDERCTVADRNDPRVREIRVFLGTGPFDQDGVVTVHFADRTRIDVGLQRVADADPQDWEQDLYQTVVLTDTVRVPGLAVVPSTPEQFSGFAYEGGSAIRAALQRLEQRFR